MKNQYEIAQNYLIKLENEELRDRIKELANEVRELKKKYETSTNDKRDNSVNEE
jgi:regulator of replication initiation timing